MSLQACPGCGVELEASAGIANTSNYNASDGCWATYTRVLGREYADAPLFGRAHQLTVDTYAAQHPGGAHRDKSVVIHLAGLHLALESHWPLPHIPRALQRLAQSGKPWPHWDPPAQRGTLTVLDVARAGSAAEHAACVRAWAEQVWRAWSERHEAIGALVALHGLVGR